MKYSKSWTQALQEVQEQTGVRKVDFVDGITPDLQEAKPEFEVKYSSSKRGPIKVSKFMSLEDAKKFLAQVKKEGMNGIISKGGKPVKEDHHEKDANGEPIPHDDEEDTIDEKASDYEDQIKAYLAKGGKIQKGDKPNKQKIDKVTKGFLKKYGVMKNKEAELDAKAKAELEKMMGEELEEKKGSDYELYHKTFSAAMQHAYAHAKKKGFTVDPDEIDNKVATGPKKPSAGKTNRYILGTDKRQKLHVQVANLDNKRYELNMYIEETEKENMDINETIKQVLEGKTKKEDASNDKSDDGEGMDKVDPKALKKKFKDRKDKDIDNDGDTDDSDEYLHKKRKAVSKAMKGESAPEPGADPDDTAKKMKKAKEPQEEGYGSGRGMVSTVYKKKKPMMNATLLDKVKGMMKEKKYKK